ncbi:hypothetical protein BH11PLA2_BH11PLA2_11920 [soil metagenome]
MPLLKKIIGWILIIFGAFGLVTASTKKSTAAPGSPEAAGEMVGGYLFVVIVIGLGWLLLRTPKEPKESTILIERGPRKPRPVQDEDKDNG